MKVELVLAILLVTIAGLSTVIGSFIVFLSKNKRHENLGFLLGIAAGIILCICFNELLPEAQELLFENFKYNIALVILFASLLIGLVLSFILDKLMHHHDDEADHDEHCKMCNVGITAAFTMALHKLPEGMAIFIAIYDNYKVAIPFALAIAVHHIPEGMIISAPIYYATGSKKKALLYSITSGLVLPVAGLLGFLFLKPFFNGITEGILLALTCSIMFYLAFKEIIPASLKYGNKKTTVFAVMIGIIFMYLVHLI